MRAPWLALVVLASLPFLLAACEAGETVTYRNETSIDLEVRVVGRSGFSALPAEATERIGYIMSTTDPWEVRVTDGTGCFVFSLDTTLRELKADQDLTITIREEDVAKCDSP